MLPFLAGPIMSVVWTIIKKFWPYILAALVILSIYMYWQYLLHKIESQAETIQRQEQVISALEQKIKTCEANFAGVKGSLDAQNQSLGKVAEQLKANQAEWKGLVSKIKTDNDKLNIELARILKDPKPESCQAAIQYLLNARKEYPK